MKWFGFALLGVGGLLVCIVIVLLVLGRRSAAGRIRGEILINRPADTVFAWITEPAKLTQWVGGLVEVRAETPGPKAVGSRESWVMQDPRQKRGMTMTSEVTLLDPGRRIDARVGVPGMFSGVGSYTVTPMGEGASRLATDSRFAYDSWFFRLLEPVITPGATKKLLEDFARLRQKLESAG